MTNGRYSKEKTKEIGTSYYLLGEQETIDAFQIKSGSLNRTLADFRKLYPEEAEKYNNLKQLKEKFTPEQIQELLKGDLIPKPQRSKLQNYENLDYVKIGVVTDTHIGSRYFDVGWWETALNKFEKDNVNFITHSGDISEGTITKTNRILELTEIGFDQQFERAEKEFKKTSKDIYCIDGNHDMWHEGVSMGKHLAKSLSNVTYLGQHEGLIKVGNINIDLWHGLDGATAYALSYRMQQIVQSLYGGEKPHVLIAGHDHKAGYFFIRNVHCIAAATLEHQTQWMRGKRSQAHTGFWEIEFGYDKKGIHDFGQRLFPFYE